MRFLIPVVLLVLTAVLVPREQRGLRVEVINEESDTLTLVNTAQWMPVLPQQMNFLLEVSGYHVPAAEPEEPEIAGVLDRLLLPGM